MEVNGKLLYYIALIFTLQLGMLDSVAPSVIAKPHEQAVNITSLATGERFSKPGEEDCQMEQEEQEVSLQNRNENDSIKGSLGFFIPDAYIVYINIGLSVLIAIVNVIVVWIFLQKKNRSPVTILLSSLAISDTISAVITSVLEFIGYIVFSNKIMNNIWYLNYPFCNIIPFLKFANDDFHLASVYMTAFLSAQKAIAVLFPLWSKTHINNKVCVVISGFIFGVVICLYVTGCAIFSHHLKVRCGKCYLPELDTNYFRWVVLTTCISYVVSVTAIIVSTVILSCKLTCLRKNLLLNESSSALNWNRRSAVIVILISVIFILSEGIMIYRLSVHFMIIIVHSHTSVFFYDKNSFYLSILNFLSFSWMIGYCLNFIVYIIMGKKLRNTLGKGCCKIFRCFNEI